MTRSFYLAILVLVFACNQHTPPTVFSPETIDSFIKDVQQTYPLPGIAVGVVSGDSTFFTYSGFSNVEDQVPVTANTRFFAGSLSELMVATATMKLVDQGRLRTDDPVERHLPYFETQGPYQHIHIHHLLTHTSGIPHFSPAWDMPSYDADALEATTRSIVFQPLEFEPGSRCLRSPYNYDILADLLSRSQQKPFEWIMDEEVLIPFQMKSSSFKPDSSAELAQPYRVNDWLSYTVSRQAVYPYTRENAGSYGFHSTAEDIAKWMKVVLAGDKSILNSLPVGELLKRHYQTGQTTYKGYGWEIAKTSKGYVYSNTWSIEGFSGSLTLFPETKTGIVLLTNTSDDFNPTVISQHIEHHLAGGKLDHVRQPIHFAMGKLMATGMCMEEVLTWTDNQIEANTADYLINPALIGQLGVNLLHRASRPKDAFKVFDYCVRKFPESPQARLNLVECLLVMGNTDEAKVQFDIAVQLGGKENSPYFSFLKEQLTIAAENEASS